MNNLGMLVIQAPAAAFAVMLFVYGYFFDKSVDSHRVRDFLMAWAALFVGSFIVIMVALFTYGVFGAFL